MLYNTLCTQPTNLGHDSRLPLVEEIDRARFNVPPNTL